MQKYLPNAIITKQTIKLLFSLKNILAALAFVVITIIFTISPPPAVDWHDTFFPVSKSPLHPYEVKTFINIPWVVFVLYPFHYVSEELSLAINASLNFIVIGALIIRRKGNFLSLFLTFTSLPFIALIINGAVEWIPAFGFVLQNGLGLSLVLIKPQTGILGIFSWFSKAKNKLPQSPNVSKSPAPARSSSPARAAAI